VMDLRDLTRAFITVAAMFAAAVLVSIASPFALDARARASTARPLPPGAGSPPPGNRPVPAGDSPAPARDNGHDEAPSDGAAVCARMVDEAASLLGQDLFEDALARAGAAVERCDGHAGAHVAKGDALYRRGDFDDAERHYRRAVALDDASAAAHFGVGRILRTLGRYGDAAPEFQRAAALEPEVPRYIRTLANHVAGRAQSIELLRRYIVLAGEKPSSEEQATIGNVEAWIALLEAAGDAPISHMEKGEPTEVRLRVTRNQPWIRMTVGEIRDRKFVFDTGATGMTISPRLARKAGLEPIRPYTIVGTGAGRIETGSLVLIDRIALGDREEGIVLRHVPATVREPAGPEEGLIGPSLFARMKITIDIKGGTLSFSNHPPGATGTAGAKGTSPTAGTTDGDRTADHATDAPTDNIETAETGAVGRPAGATDTRDGAPPPRSTGDAAAGVDGKRSGTGDAPGPGAEDRPPSRPGVHVEPFRNVGGEIFIPARLNGTAFNAMLDTGSASTIIGRTAVSRLPDLDALPGQWFAGTTVGVGGPLGERRVILRGTLRLAGRDYPADGLLSGDLGGISRSVESEVYAILGVPHLDDFVITIDYRAMTVTFRERD